MKRNITTLLFTLLLMAFQSNTMMAQKTWRYRGFVEFGHIFDHGGQNSSQWRGTTSHGIENTDWGLFVGAGIGYGEIGYRTGKRNACIPYFLDVRYSPLKGQFRPFADLKVGHGNIVETLNEGTQDWSGGFYFHPSIGLSAPLGGKFEMFYTIGYAYQRASSNVLWSGSSKYGVNIGHLSISLGLAF